MFVQMFFAWRVKVLTGSIPAVLFMHVLFFLPMVYVPHFYDFHSTLN